MANPSRLPNSVPRSAPVVMRHCEPADLLGGLERAKYAIRPSKFPRAVSCSAFCITRRPACSSASERARAWCTSPCCDFPRIRRPVRSHEPLVGPTSAGSSLEVMYASNGQLAGRGIAPGDPSSSYRIADVRGGRTIDESVRVCTTMRIGGMDLPTRCQAWFKLGDVYYISDSDTDRRGKVLRRELKATSALVAGPDDLGPTS